jgi:hypothetical protein
MPADTSDPRATLRSIAAGLRTRLEGEGRAGLTAVPRATPEVSAPAAVGSAPLLPKRARK